MRLFLMPSKAFLMLRGPGTTGRVSKHARHPMQRILAQPFAQPILRAPSGRVHGNVTVLLQVYGIVQRNEGSAAEARAWLGTRSIMIFW
jgi:hypothetical protein